MTYLWKFWKTSWTNCNFNHSTDTDIPIPIYRYRLEEYSNRYRYTQNPPYLYRTDTDISVWYRYRVHTDFDTDIWYRYYIKKPGMKPGYRYRYPPYLYQTDNNIPHISHIELIPIPGSYRFLSYRYRYRVSVSYRVSVELYLWYMLKIRPCPFKSLIQNFSLQERPKLTASSFRSF